MSFRDFRGLVQFRSKVMFKDGVAVAGGSIMTKVRHEGVKPCCIDEAWFDGVGWRTDFGGYWVPQRGGKLKWVWN